MSRALRSEVRVDIGWRLLLLAFAAGTDATLATFDRPLPELARKRCDHSALAG